MRKRERERESNKEQLMGLKTLTYILLPSTWFSHKHMIYVGNLCVI